MRSSPYSIAMISVHSSPVGRLGTQDTGGMSVYIRELSRQLGLRGQRVDIFTRAEGGHASGEALCISENVRLIPLELGPGAAAPKNALHPHLARFFEALERFRSRDGRSYDLVHSHYWLSGRVGQWARQAWGCPHLTTFHTLAAVKNRVCGPGTEPDARVDAEHELAGTCDRIVVASVRERDHLIRYCGAEAERIAVVRCGVDVDRFRPLDRTTARRRIGASPHETLVLYVGRLAPEKGLDRLIRAVARLTHVPALRLIVVGGDGERDAAQRRMAALAGSLGIDGRVAFKGRVEQHELPHYYSAADLLALPSAYESFGMVALEALACGTPVAATRVGAMEELLQTPSSGRLSDDLRPASLADAIESLLRQRAAAPHPIAAVRRAVLDYGWSRVATDVWEVYADCLADAGDPVPELAAGFHHHPRDGRRSCCGCGCGALTPA
ncbi:MAG: glycosyltransferase [Desulfobacterales bacterium]|nr:glycosyltransferase [Desulfobacterales bacterium]